MCLQPISLSIRSFSDSLLISKGKVVILVKITRGLVYTILHCGVETHRREYLVGLFFLVRDPGNDREPTGDYLGGPILTCYTLFTVEGGGEVCGWTEDPGSLVVSSGLQWWTFGQPLDTDRHRECVPPFGRVSLVPKPGVLIIWS